MRDWKSYPTFDKEKISNDIKKDCEKAAKNCKSEFAQKCKLAFQKEVGTQIKSPSSSSASSSSDDNEKTKRKRKLEKPTQKIENVYNKNNSNSNANHQWSNADLGSKKQTDKFLKLMGAKNAKNSKKSTNSCLNRKQAENLNQKLEDQFNKARSSHFSRGFTN